MNIYIISDGINLKIGISKNPEKRLKQLQTGHPRRLKLEFTLETSPEKARKIERLLHNILWQSRTKYDGEWFQLPPDEWLFNYIKSLIV